MLEFGDSRLPDRFWSKVHPEPNSGCWLWSGSVAPGGYGQFWLGRLLRCSRLIMVAHQGSLEAQANVCHRCDNPNCCNPEHLFVGTQADNMHDMLRKGRQWAGPQPKPVCARGHPKTPANTCPSGECRTCRRARQRATYRKGLN